MLAAILILYAAVLGFVLREFISRNRRSKITQEALATIEAERELLKQRHEDKEEDLKKRRKELEKEYEDSVIRARKEISIDRKKLSERLEALEKKADVLENKELELSKKQREFNEFKIKYEEKELQVEEMRAKEESILNKISRFSPKQAREEIMRRAEEECMADVKKNRVRILENARRSAQREAVEIIAQAIQRNAAEVTQEITVTSVSIPDEDMKGRIIGREGRNVRALESETGVSFIIDDTPGVITISSFDGVRREIAKRSLEILMKDGRIQPAKIEEVVKKVSEEMDEVLKEYGEEAAMDSGVTVLHDELIFLLGRLRYRTSYGQNVLEHSVSVAHLAGVMAEELELDVDFARRAGLLHDIGKAVDRDTQGTHSAIGARLAKKFGENQRVQNAIAAHHNDISVDTVEAILIQAADAISASRPGARSEQIGNYIKRMHALEDIAKSFKGVYEAYCISAGREIRVMVEPGEISDEGAADLAEECAKKIENELEYPGEIKVTVIRNLRTTGLAR